jgi:hypothetical protein
VELVYRLGLSRIKHIAQAMGAVTLIGDFGMPKVEFQKSRRTQSFYNN